MSASATKLPAIRDKKFLLEETQMICMWVVNVAKLSSELSLLRKAPSVLNALLSNTFLTEDIRTAFFFGKLRLDSRGLAIVMFRHLRGLQLNASSICRCIKTKDRVCFLSIELFNYKQ